MPKSSTVAVIGAGSWGTAIAGLLSEKGCKTYLWGHRLEHIQNLRQERCNAKYLPEYTFNENLIPTADLQRAVSRCSVICMVVPSQSYRSVFETIVQYINDDNTIIVSAVKGIETGSLSTMTQIMEEVLDQHGKKSKRVELAVLSGPSFAQEVAAKMPTAVTIGCKNLSIAKKLQVFFGSDIFRVYASSDVMGLEVSAAFKNVIAIATGICDGLGYGLNTRAALITRGLAEITRFGVRTGADPQTFSGLSGIGDLVLTCTGSLSRNRTVGLKLGEGLNLSTILAEMKMVAEGVKTSQSAYKLTCQKRVEMPILEQVYKILYENKDCSQAVCDLLSRELKTE